MPCLAICENKSETADAVLLFLCDEKWSDVGCSGFASIAEARDWAERRYPGVSSRWVQAYISEEEAEHYLGRIVGRREM